VKIKIGFSTSQLWISRLIRWVTKATVSHTFIIVEDGDFGYPMVLQEAWQGFSQQTLDNFKASGNVVLDVIDPKVPLNIGLVAVAPLLGSQYGYLQLIGAGCVRLAKVFRKKIRNPFRNTRSLFCSEMNVKILQKSGYQGADALDPSNTSPEDLLEFLKKEQQS
jgi:hypothetical protein